MVLAVSNFIKHDPGAEQQLPHDVSQKAGVHLWVVQLCGQGEAVVDELVPTGSLVAVQGQDGHTEVCAGSLER